MPELNITRNYADGDVLVKADLDNIHEAVSTLNNTTKYDDDNLQAAAITSSHLVDATVTATELGTSSVSTSKIADATVTAVKITDGVVATTHIDSSAVTTAKLATNSVTTAKFNTDNRFTAAKFAGTKGFFTASIASSDIYQTDGTVTLATITTSQDVDNAFILVQGSNGGADALYLHSGTNATPGTYPKTSYTATISLKINGTTVESRYLAFSTYDDTYAGSCFVSIPLPSLAFNYRSSLSSGATIAVTAAVSSTGAISGTKATEAHLLGITGTLVAIEL